MPPHAREVLSRLPVELDAELDLPRRGHRAPRRGQWRSDPSCDPSWRELPRGGREDKFKPLSIRQYGTHVIQIWAADMVCIDDPAR